MSANRILIVEDELFVAVDLEALVQRHDAAAQIILCASVSEAYAASAEPLELALLDVDVVDGKTFGVATLLQDKGVPVVFVSGSRPDDLPAHLGHVPFIPKPFTGPAIQDALARLVSGNGS